MLEDGSLQADRVVLYPPAETAAPAAARLFVQARLCENGDLCIEGQDLSGAGPGGDEYEYTHTVRAADVPTVAAALGGSPEDVLGLLRAHGAAIVEQGERHWLVSLGLQPGFSCWP